MLYLITIEILIFASVIVGVSWFLLKRVNRTANELRTQMVCVADIYALALKNRIEVLSEAIEAFSEDEQYEEASECKREMEYCKSILNQLYGNKAKVY